MSLFPALSTIPAQVHLRQQHVVQAHSSAGMAFKASEEKYTMLFAHLGLDT